MANIVVAWELGTGLGHLSYLSVIIKQLSEKGHNLTLVLNDPANLSAFDLPESLLILPAPSYKTLPVRQQPTVSLPCILKNRGFQSIEILRGMVRCWHGIFKVTKPDLFIFDYAPLAMLASRGMSCPKVMVGSGFSELVEGQPSLVMRPDLKEAVNIAKGSESRLVGLINHVCDELNYTRIHYFSDLYQNDLALISTQPELDMYDREGGDCLYFTPENRLSENLLNWSTENKPRVFAYLTMGKQGVIEVLDVLVANDVEVICYCLRMPPKLIENYRRKGIVFSLEPVDTSRLLQTADLVVCHAGKGLISESLYNGVPLFMLPFQMEQGMNVLRVKGLGAGLSLDVEPSFSVLNKAIKRLLSEPAFRENAQKISSKYLNSDALVTLETVSNRINDLIEKR